MKKKIVHMGFWLLAGWTTLFLDTLPVRAQVNLPEQRPGWCKNEVMNRFDTYRADVQITGQQGNEVYWRINSTGRKGKCHFDRHHEFLWIEVDRDMPIYHATGAIYWHTQARQWIAPDGGICHSCTPENGFPNPPSTQDGFFFLPNDGLWYDPDGYPCYSCTPDHGFPIPPVISNP
ncbi:hypothetical protein [Roseofilum capinflatum]|uniref:Uncharacterized protein n=1 Tax=Roseofilum capinflatum BLCC-M114 TaxID=3022440 RepID=A0ABT7B1N2_9CYAN|nr:hypothetical protein [Roseofilum capinflatum]MDJ1173070.1 hypothetical protein [Roseofilum capinflatum BLCC-M114]